MSSITFFRLNQHSLTIFVLAVTVFPCSKTILHMITLIKWSLYFMISTDCQFNINVSAWLLYNVISLCFVSVALNTYVCVCVCMCGLYQQNPKFGGNWYMLKMETFWFPIDLGANLWKFSVCSKLHVSTISDIALPTVFTLDTNA